MSHYTCPFVFFLFFFKPKTAYEVGISDWSSDVCSSDLWRVYGTAWESTEAMSALPGTLDRVKELTSHPACSIRNPNKVRALIELGRASCRERVCQYV